jgi:hypothetical protein
MSCEGKFPILSTTVIKMVILKLYLLPGCCYIVHLLAVQSNELVSDKLKV